jgi:hypothetical protein
MSANSQLLRSVVALATLAGLSSGCVNTADQFRPVVTDVPAVYDIGELQVIDSATLVGGVEDPASIADSLHYGQLGASENPGVFGGATFEFQGTGDTVCVVVDPEAVFWNREISTQGSTAQKYKYDDVFEDDGDIDLSVGLSAYYTGSPGTEVGDFDATYTDSAGVDHTLAFNECTQIGLFGDLAHAGRATVEYCEIDTSLREGVMYTALLKTFALPIDDSILNFGTLAFDGSCSALPWYDDDGAVETGATECVIPNEVANAEEDGQAKDGKDWFPELETAFCGGPNKTNKFCGDHVADDSPPCHEPPE